MCILIICIIILIVSGIYYIENYNYTDCIVGNKSFKVLEDKPNQTHAAHILNEVDSNLLKLIIYMKEKYSDDSVLSLEDPMKKQLLLNIIKKLNKTYKSNSLRENYPSSPGVDVSYNINKGYKISMCLRNFEDPNEFHKINDIMFVAIHELAHSCNESYGHDTKFWKIFRILLEHSLEIDIFKNTNYRKNNVNYCSMNITYNPIFDSSLDDKYYFKKNK